MDTLKGYISVVTKINEKIAYYSAYLMPVLILTLVYEVIARYGFDSPTQWSFDLTYFLCSIVIVFGLADTWNRGGHVRVDLISAKLSRKVEAGLNVFFMLTLFFLCWLNILYVLIKHVSTSWAIYERATTGFLPPIYPYKTWILVGVVMMIFHGTVVLIRELYYLVKGEELR